MAKKWHERSEADKKRIDDWALRNRLNYMEQRRKERLATRTLKKQFEAKKKHKQDMIANGHAIVSKIHWVKDTPFSLTTKFLEWRAKRAKQ